MKFFCQVIGGVIDFLANKGDTELIKPEMLKEDKVQIALAPNINPFVSGFYCTWVNIKNNGKKKTAFNLKLKDNEVIRIPIAHGEGRFVIKDKLLLKELIKNNQVIFRYCDADGKTEDKFPVNPNGSVYNISSNHI